MALGATAILKLDRPSMATIAEIQFAHEEGALAGTLEELSDVETKVIRETSTEPEQNLYFIRFDLGNPGEIHPALEGDRTVQSASPLTETSTSQVWRVEFADRAKLLDPQVTREGGFVLHARSTALDGDRWGWHERWLLPDHEALNTIWQDAREDGFEFEILHYHTWGGNLSEHSDVRTLTEEQREAVVLANERGYFQEPRETDLAALADELGISTSAAAGRLKRGMKLLIEKTLIVDDRAD